MAWFFLFREVPHIKVSINTSGLDKILKDLKAKKSVQVGVFKTAVYPDGKSVAEVAVQNEYGVKSKRIPARSFIKMPLEHEAKLITSNVNKAATKDLENGNIDIIYKKIGMACESAIQKAFESRGFGLWLDNSPVTIEKKGSSSPLIDIGVMRRSVTSRVSDDT